MARVEFKTDKFVNMRPASVKVGWIDTPEHPGYPERKASGATIAAVAKFNTHHRNFAEAFVEKFMLTAGLRRALAKDMKMALVDKRFTGNVTALYLKSGLIETIKLGSWPANTQEWLKFKVKHGLSLDPLIASQVMLDSIVSEVNRL